MGTVFSFDIRTPGVDPRALQRVIDWLHAVDARFSTYRADSEIRRLDRGELTLEQCSPDVRRVLDLCAVAAESSGGYFSTTIDGKLDPSGMVKGWAIEQASSMLREAGSTAHAVNGGGDIQLAGDAAPGRPWTVGIADPFRRGALAATVSGTGLAIATSSTAERGAHIINPGTGEPAVALASITLTGEHLTIIDAYATAALAMGEEARAWIESLTGVEAFAITATGKTWQTPHFPTTSSPG
jgi:thiamine biosynthesis lipoprotein